MVWSQLCLWRRLDPETWLFLSGFKGDWWKAPLPSPIAATCPFRAASTNIMLRCVIAGVAEKKSSLPFRVSSYPRVVHLAFLAPSSCMVPAQRPVQRLVVASVRRTTLMNASSTFVSSSRRIRLASAIASDALVSNTLNECPCLRCCRGLRGRLGCGRHWNGCSCSLRQWCSLGFCLCWPHPRSFCDRLRCLPRSGLLAWCCCCRWVQDHCELSQWSSFPNRGVQESGVLPSSFNSASQRTAANHAIRCSDHVLICFAAMSEPNTFEPCCFQFVDQCSCLSVRNCLSSE